MRMLAKGLLASAILALAVAAPVAAATHNIQKDFEVTGRVVTAFNTKRLPAELTLNISGQKVEILVNRSTEFVIAVKPGTTEKPAVEAGDWAQVSFHVDKQGQRLANLVAVWAGPLQCSNPGPNGPYGGGPPSGGAGFGPSSGGPGLGNEFGGGPPSGCAEPN
jgi:hypothetical protein